VHDLTPAAELLHGDEEIVYGDAGYQGIAKRPEMAGKSTEFRVAMRPGKRRTLPDNPDGRLKDLVKTAKAHVRAKVENPPAWPGKEPLQNQCAVSADESVPGPSTFACNSMTSGLVCPKGAIERIKTEL
jgi:hypothetical protein